MDLCDSRSGDERTCADDDPTRLSNPLPTRSHKYGYLKGSYMVGTRYHPYSIQMYISTICNKKTRIEWMALILMGNFVDR